MEPFRILVVSDSFHNLPEAVAMLNVSGHQIMYVKGLIPWAELAPDNRLALSEAHAVIMGRVPGLDAAAFSLAPNLRAVALHTSGSDTVDLDEATRRNVIVTNVKGANAAQCAEFAIGLMLCVVRQIRIGDQAIRAGLWNGRTETSMDVQGATLGVIGFGQIAKAFVKRARAFGVRILVHTRTPDPALETEFGIEYTSLDQVLKQGDIVSLFASLTRETRGMIAAKELRLMKKSAYLINIARGELIDQQALLEALQTGQIAGAGLDVFEVEPLVESPLFALDNVVLTPHQAGLTQAGKACAAVRAARNALEALDGTIPQDAINPDAWRVRPAARLL